MVEPMLLEELLTDYLPGHHNNPWTWEDEEQSILIRICLCCGCRGHYQEQLESYIGNFGLENMGICLGEYGFVWDGHHRIIAAKHLGITTIPLEDREDADIRWVRDHGTKSWEERTIGDR